MTNKSFLITGAGKTFASINTFKRFALQNDRTEHMGKTIDKQEEIFWRSIGEYSDVQYGADLDCKCIYLENINRSFGILDSLDVNISGITTPFAYIGSWGSHFTWHTEDMDLYSMNILIEGAPKVWYCVPPQV